MISTIDTDARRSPFAVGQIAEKWLTRMHERSTSDQLTLAVEQLVPSLAGGD